MNNEQLQEQLISERAQRLKQYDDAYPDVGMPAPVSYFRDQAIDQLIAEGLLPEDYKRLLT